MRKPSGEGADKVFDLELERKIDAVQKKARGDTEKQESTPFDKLPFIEVSGSDHWEGRELAYLRKAMEEVIRKQKKRKLIIDFSGVEHLHPGVFGAMDDWAKIGIKIYLSRPTPIVKAMIWFDRFTVRVVDDTSDLFLMVPEGNPLSRPVQVERNLTEDEIKALLAIRK